MSIIQLIQCDGGCKTTLDLNEDLPEGWQSRNKGRLHICPECDETRKAVETWQQDRERTRLATEKAQRKVVADLMAAWEVENPKPGVTSHSTSSSEEDEEVIIKVDPGEGEVTRE